ncbi:uncharacterized protein LOC111397619 [Olea europaea var. sylvestris]|uniref:uncharacterized protein LOC111397619 n=1 Tax=Olea europaea var. sylvestris TaxID=158386 RepID=UPI000C1D5722|nr:uncharacterized protein LOC111397619 [Olea europaea var. sylvestris]
MAAGNMQTAKACGICSVAGHPTDMCPTLQEDEQFNAVGSFPGQPQRNYNPYSNTYNLGWKDHPNLSYGNQQVNQPIFQQYSQLSPPRQQQDQTSSSGMPLEVIVKSLATNILQFQQETKQFEQEAKASIKSLENQMGQMATTINRLEAQGSGKLPSQTMVNPRENVSAILSRSGKKVEIPRVNIPLLDAIKQVPHYAKFLKELCTIKRKQKLERCEKINVEENISAIIERNLPTKCKDPGMFSIPCTIGNNRFEKTMLDLGASINVMSYYVYASLKLGPLNETGVIIQLVDKSNAYPKGVVEDILVKINDLVFPADFYVLDMGYSDQTIPILLGRPFLRMSKAKIDFYSGMLTMEFDDKISEFNIYDAIKHPDETNPVYSIQELPSITTLQETVAALDASPKSSKSSKSSHIVLPIANERPFYTGFQMDEVRTWDLGNPIDAG